MPIRDQTTHGHLIPNFSPDDFMRIGFENTCSSDLIWFVCKTESNNPSGHRSDHETVHFGLFTNQNSCPGPRDLAQSFPRIFRFHAFFNPRPKLWRWIRANTRWYKSEKDKHSTVHIFGSEWSVLRQERIRRIRGCGVGPPAIASANTPRSFHDPLWPPRVKLNIP